MPGKNRRATSNNSLIGQQEWFRGWHSGYSRLTGWIPSRARLASGAVECLQKPVAGTMIHG
jgi:hypothetical protein